MYRDIALPGGGGEPTPGRSNRRYPLNDVDVFVIESIGSCCAEYEGRLFLQMKSLEISG